MTATGDIPSPPQAAGRLQRLRGSPATTGLLAALVVAFLASSAHPELVGRFAKVDVRIRDGEWWRLFTASFLHGGVIHLGVNCLALYSIGPTVEHIYGRVRFLIAFLLGGAVGFLASAAFVRQPSLGASAGLFALLGLLLGFGIRERRRLDPIARRAGMRQILSVAALNLALGFMVPFVDNAAHLGGLLGGFGLGLLLRPLSALPPRSGRAVPVSPEP